MLVPNILQFGYIYRRAYCQGDGPNWDKFEWIYWNNCNLLSYFYCLISLPCIYTRLHCSMSCAFKCCMLNLKCITNVAYHTCYAIACKKFNFNCKRTYNWRWSLERSKHVLQTKSCCSFFKNSSLFLSRPFGSIIKNKIPYTFTAKRYRYVKYIFIPNRGPEDEVVVNCTSK